MSAPMVLTNDEVGLLLILRQLPPDAVARILREIIQRARKAKDGGAA